MIKTIELVGLNGEDIGERLWTNGQIAKLYGPYAKKGGTLLDWRDVKNILESYSSLTTEEVNEIVKPLFDLFQPKF